jgi:putative PEP-CTERM system TPR-repeat lipoprotein
MKRLSVLAMLLALVAGCDRFTSAETRVKRAETAIAAGQHRAAVVDLMNALKDEPELDSARLLLAEAALWLGDPQGAQRELNRLKTPMDAQRALLEGRIALALGRGEAVIQRFTESEFPLPLGQREMLLGTASMQIGRPADAQRWFEAAAEADPELIEARASALEARAVQGARQPALAGLRQLTAEHDGSAAAWMAYGMMLVSTGDSAAASQALQKAHDLAAGQLDLTRHAALLAMLVETQLLQGKLEDARRSGAALDRLAPDALAARYVASRIAMAQNDYVTAVEHLRKVVEAAPMLQQGRLLLSIALIAQGNLEQASKELNTLIGQAPENAVARQLLGQVRMRLDDPDGALRMLVPALQPDGVNPEVNALIDAARSQLGAAQSVALLEQMLAKEPDNRALQTQLATAYLQAGTPARAAELLRASGDSADVQRAALLVSAIARAEGSPAARSQVDALLAAHPADARLANLAAVFYSRAGDPDAGRRTLNAALKGGAEPGILLLALAQLEWSAGQRGAADAAIAQLLKLEPKNPAAHMAAGQSALARGSLDDARKHFEAVRAARPESFDARLLLAQVALGQSDGKQADEWLGEAVKLAPRSATVRNAAGTLNLNFGRADRALEHFREAVALDAADPVGWFNLARTQRALGQAGAARDSLEKALTARADWLPAVAALVALDVEAKDSEAAFARVAELRKAQPRDPEVRLLEADLLAAVQRFPAASEAYEATYALAPSAPVAIRDYRVRTAGDLPQPARMLERWSAANPRDVDSRIVLADAAIRGGDRAGAAEHYRAVLAARPADFVALNNLAWLYHELGDKRAVALAREAVRLAPHAPAIVDTLGWLLVQQGAADEGLQYLKTAVGQPGATTEIRYHHAVALARTGAIEEARRQLQEVLRDPQFANRSEAERLLRELPPGGSGGS